MNFNTESVFQKNKIGLGRRKEAVARVSFTAGNGNLIINKIPNINSPICFDLRIENV